VLKPEDFKDHQPPGRRRGGLGLTVLAAASLSIASTVVIGASLNRTAASGAAIWVQTMDSCREALGSAQYEIVNKSNTFSARVSTPAAPPASVASGACPLERGNCSARSTGCVQFANLPLPDSYKIREIATPPGNPSNPQGYAPCEGGSACQWQVADVSIDSAGRVTAVTTNIEPDGTRQLFPSSGSVAGLAMDPIIFHDYGLGTGSCDGDSDADDHGTGSGPGAHCRYPEASEGSASRPYPWSSGGTTATPCSCSQKGSKPGSHPKAAHADRDRKAQPRHKSKGSHPDNR
jgi:hypothetical protein